MLRIGFFTYVIKRTSIFGMFARYQLVAVGVVWEKFDEFTDGVSFPNERMRA